MVILTYDLLLAVTKGGVGRHAKHVAPSDQEFVLKVSAPDFVLSKAILTLHD